MSNSFIMTESIVRPAKMPYGRLKDNGFVGIEGEHAARALVVETKDDLSAFASINLIIDDLDCGAMTKTTSGNTTTLSMTLTSSMIGRSGRKICQLIMVNSDNTVVQKSSQFEAYVGRANEIERSVDDGVTIIILSEAVTEMAREAAAAAAEEAVADVVEDCQAIADAASASADAAAQSASDAQTAAASITVDATLDPTSTHAIQNKAVASEISSIKADLEDNVNNLKGAIRNDGISIESSSNMIDPSVFVHASGIHVDSAGYYIGTAGDFNTNFGAEIGVPGLSFETGKQYSFRVTVYSDNSESTSNGIRFRFYYTDNTNSNVSVPINTNTPTQITGTSTSGKTVSKFCILYANGPSVVWHIKDFMLSQSASPENFVPHLVPVDSVARGIASENTQEIELLSTEQIEILEKIPTKVVNIQATWSRGYWNTQTDVASFETYSGSYYASNAIGVMPGRTYAIYVKGGTSSKQRPVVVVDASYNVLYKCDAFSTIQTVTVTIPANGAYLLVTNYKSSFDDAIISTTALDDIPGCNVVRLDILKGKKVAIIGDSISTNGNPGSGDYPNAVEITITNDDVGIELSAYLTKFDVDAGLSLGGHTFTSEEIGTEVTFTPTLADVGKVIGLPNNYNTNVTKTWWEVAMERLGFTPIPVCWSGASITSHEADSNTYKTSYAWHDAQIRKCGIRTPGTMDRTAPDMIIVYRGTNDFSHSPVTRVTENYPGGVSWMYPETDVVQTDKFGFKEGLCLLVKKLRQAYPNATIYFCTLNVFKRMNYANFPTRNSYNTLPEYNDAIRETARFLGIDVIDFANDGITFENCYIGGYITDSAETPTHPSDKGHKVMGEKAVADLLASYSPLT